MVIRWRDRLEVSCGSRSVASVVLAAIRVPPVFGLPGGRLAAGASADGFVAGEGDAPGEAMTAGDTVTAGDAGADDAAGLTASAGGAGAAVDGAGALGVHAASSVAAPLRSAAPCRNDLRERRHCPSARGRGSVMPAHSFYGYGGWAYGGWGYERWWDEGGLARWGRAGAGTAILRLKRAGLPPWTSTSNTIARLAAWAPRAGVDELWARRLLRVGCL